MTEQAKNVEQAELLEWAEIDFGQRWRRWTAPSALADKDGAPWIYHVVRRGDGWSIRLTSEALLEDHAPGENRDFPTRRDAQAECERIEAIVRASMEAETDDRLPARHQPCGCVLCVCEDEEQCHGCGAKNCGKPDDQCSLKNGETVYADAPESPAAPAPAAE